MIIYSPTRFCSSEKISTSSCPSKTQDQKDSKTLGCPQISKNKHTEWIKPGIFKYHLDIVRRNALDFYRGLLGILDLLECVEPNPLSWRGYNQIVPEHQCLCLRCTCNVRHWAISFAHIVHSLYSGNEFTVSKAFILWAILGLLAINPFPAHWI